MAILETGDALNGVDDLPRVTVNVPEWGYDIIIKTMTGKERDAYEASMMQKNGKETKFSIENYRVKLLAKCIVNSKGEQILTEKQLERRSSKAISRLYDVAQELNGLRSDAEDEALKNSNGEGIDTSISPSPKNSE